MSCACSCFGFSEVGPTVRAWLVRLGRREMLYSKPTIKGNDTLNSSGPAPQSFSPMSPFFLEGRAAGPVYVFRDPDVAIEFLFQIRASFFGQPALPTLNLSVRLLAGLQHNPYISDRIFHCQRVQGFNLKCATAPSETVTKDFKPAVPEGLTSCGPKWRECLRFRVGGIENDIHHVNLTDVHRPDFKCF